jgi:hypothetical protein
MDPVSLFGPFTSDEQIIAEKIASFPERCEATKAKEKEVALKRKKKDFELVIQRRKEDYMLGYLHASNLRGTRPHCVGNVHKQPSSAAPFETRYPQGAVIIPEGPTPLEFKKPLPPKQNKKKSPSPLIEQTKITQKRKRTNKEIELIASIQRVKRQWMERKKPVPVETSYEPIPVDLTIVRVESQSEDDDGFEIRSIEDTDDEVAICPTPPRPDTLTNFSDDDEDWTSPDYSNYWSRGSRHSESCLFCD